MSGNLGLYKYLWPGSVVEPVSFSYGGTISQIPNTALS